MQNVYMYNVVTISHQYNYFSTVHFKKDAGKERKL